MKGINKKINDILGAISQDKYIAEPSTKMKDSVIILLPKHHILRYSKLWAINCKDFSTIEKILYECYELMQQNQDKEVIYMYSKSEPAISQRVRQINNMAIAAIS